MSIRSRLAAAPGFFAKPGLAEAAVVIALAVVGAAMILVFFYGDLAKVLETIPRTPSP